MISAELFIQANKKKSYAILQVITYNTPPVIALQTNLIGIGG
jgi:hypothetical protein